ncbi:MAG: GWxTD domain-containing protein [Bacteroidota bacterium]
MKKGNYILFAFLILLTGCYTTGRLAYTNMAELYSNNTRCLIMQPHVFHTSDSTTLLQVSVAFNYLQYKKKSENAQPKASYNIMYQLYPSLESYHLIDSASNNNSDSLYYGLAISNKHEFIVKTLLENDYILKITLTDYNSKQSYTYIQNINRSQKANRLYFSLLDENKNYLPGNYVYPNKKIYLKTLLPATMLFVKVYKRNFPIAQPPFSESLIKPFDYHPDSTFTISVINGEADLISISENSFYHFQTDTMTSEGYSVFSYRKAFPEVESVEDMIPSTRYITTKNEFDEMIQSKDKKNAIDKFWLGIAGTPERAQKLIRNYYNRVQEANRYFTSYTEGWKTDRGMIYIVFGPPTIVYLGSDGEKWIYGTDKNSLSISYNFTKVINPFCDNDFRLERNASLKYYWYQGVDSWRQ